MYCYLCYCDVVGTYREDYEITFGERACVLCLDRAAREFGPAWRTIAPPGCYAGGRIDPHLLNLHPAQKEITLDDIQAAYNEVMGGRPTEQSFNTAFGGLPGFAAWGQVVYNRYVPEGTMLLYGGKKAGQSAIIYKDTYAHWEHRFRLAMKKPLEEIDATLDAALYQMHRSLDSLDIKTLKAIEDTDPIYITVDFPSGIQVRSLDDWQQSEWGWS